MITARDNCGDQLHSQHRGSFQGESKMFLYIGNGQVKSMCTKSTGLGTQIWGLVFNCLSVPLRGSSEGSLSDKRLLCQPRPPGGTVDLPGPTERLKQAPRGLPAFLSLRKCLQSLQHQVFLLNRRDGGR